MADIHDTEGLMVWIINQLADKFGGHAILKGGMQLRLVDCPRTTNDLDYVFIPFSTKKGIGESILKALQENPDLHVSYSMNSKCIRYLVQLNSIKVQIEANVAMHCDSQELSTSSLATTKNQQPRIIRVMHFSSALSHKLAAWNERGLMRDLYDVYYMAVLLNVTPNLAVLKSRLANVQNRAKGSKKTAMSLADFAAKLEKTLAFITLESVANELSDYLSPEELPGLDRKITGGVRRIIEWLSAGEEG